MGIEYCNIGSRLEDKRLTSVDLASTRTLLDFDVLFIDPINIADRHPYFPRRKADLTEVLGLGRTVVWFIGAAPIHLLLPIEDTFGRAYSGTKTEFIGPDNLRQFWTEIEPTTEYQAYLEGAYG